MTKIKKLPGISNVSDSKAKDDCSSTTNESNKYSDYFIKSETDSGDNSLIESHAKEIFKNNLEDKYDYGLDILEKTKFNFNSKGFEEELNKGLQTLVSDFTQQLEPIIESYNSEVFDNEEYEVTMDLVPHFKIVAKKL